MAKRDATKHCCWGKCNSDSRYPERLPKETYFIRFPKPGRIRDNMTEWEKNQAKLKTEKAKRWQYLCGRKDFQNLKQITKDTYICSLHFVGGKGPEGKDAEPMLATLTPEESEKQQNRKRKAPLKRHEFPCKKKKITLPIDDNQPEGPGGNQVKEITSACETSPISPPEPDEQERSFKNCCDRGTQTQYEQYVLGAKVETMILRNQTVVQESDDCISNRVNMLHPNVVLKNRQKTKFFTGLFPEQFETLFTFLGPAKYHLKYWDSKGRDNAKEPNQRNTEKTGPTRRFTPKEEMYVTLLRLRRGFSLTTIAHLFEVSESSVSRSFITWIQFMFLHFKGMKNVMFPSKSVLKQSLPKVFRSFKNIRCSVDCTEFFCQTPRDYGRQGNTYSSYKHHTTLKALIAVTPRGAACFVSDLYEGSVSDVDIFERCGMLNHIEPGDVLLVDKGFTVQDLLLSRQATIKIPAFLGKRDSLTAEEEMSTRRIAKARIHVERFNERLKKFRLIGKVIPLSVGHLASQMVYVCCCLVNFQASLCK